MINAIIIDNKGLKRVPKPAPTNRITKPILIPKSIPVTKALLRKSLIIVIPPIA